MGIIKKLPLEVIRYIAAGEVVQRPAQVIKELLDNALDAGAQTIDISMVNSGLDKIVVWDDGIGMEYTDLLESWKKHTTSKLSDLDDFNRHTAMGYRGEALHSIAGVSELEIHSRFHNSPRGGSVIINNGTLTNTFEKGMPKGTTVIVNHIFSELPVRKKYIKNTKKELREVVKVVSQYALIYPNVSIKLKNNGSILINTDEASQTLLDRISYIFNNSLAEKLISIDNNKEKYSIKGYISKPQLSRKTKKYQYLSVNNRPIEDAAISQLIKKTYGPLLEPHAQPLFVLNINLEPADLDINIHPRKAEVEFNHRDEVHFFIEEALLTSLKNENLTYTYTSDSEKKLYLKDTSTINFTKDFIKEATKNAFSLKETDAQESIIQIDNTYLLYATQEGIMLVDQHAAHERILFEEYKNSFNTLISQTQELTKPKLITLSKQDQEALVEHGDVLRKLGFNFQIKKDTVYLVSLPTVFLEHKVDSLILDIIDDLELSPEGYIFDSQTKKVLNFLACRNAVMAGEFLTQEERIKLIKKLDACEGAYTCPHGRPVKVALTVSDLEKIFLRRK